MLGWVGNDQPMKMRETSRGVDKKLHVNNNPEFEEKIKMIIEELSERDDIILFIDEIHTIVGAGATGDSSVDAGNMLKPALARGTIKVIGATTFDEYSKYIQKDKALDRRFARVNVEETNVEQTKAILEGIKYKYEDFHKVRFSSEAVDTTIELANKYITDRFQPDKSIDLMDEVCSRVSLKKSSKRPELTRINEQLRELELIKNEAIKNEEYSVAAGYISEINDLIEEADKIKTKIAAESNKIVDVTKENIAEVIEMWTGIPATKMLESEMAKLQNLENVLHERVVGQDEAISAVSRAIRRNRTGLGDPKKPIGSFFFSGPSGVGKTELVKALAEAQFDDEDNIVRIDCSELMESHTVSKLIGSPAGYVGYDDGGGLLTDSVRQKPYTIVLFDEIEKAHPKVLDILLQILDDGRLTDNHGRVVNFKNTIIVMTSNIGCKGVAVSKKVGFSSSEEEKVANGEKDLRKSVDEAMKKHFRPEFINRIDDIVIFHSLTKENIRDIVKLMTKELVNRVAEKGIELTLTKKVMDFIGEKGTDLKYGARPLKRTIQKYLEDSLTDAIIAGKIKEGDRVTASLNGEKVVYKKKADKVEA